MLKKSTRKKREAVMLQEIRDFFRTYNRVPTYKDFNSSYFFTYTYFTYRNWFKSFENAIKKANINEKYMTSYNRNLISGKIRTLLRKKPDAGRKELEEVFGNLTRSIQVMYYRLHLELLGKSGSLRKKCTKQKPSKRITQTDKILEYMRQHPTATPKKCAAQTGTRAHYVSQITYMARKKGTLPDWRNQHV